MWNENRSCRFGQSRPLLLADRHKVSRPMTGDSGNCAKVSRRVRRSNEEVVQIVDVALPATDVFYDRPMMEEAITQSMIRRTETTSTHRDVSRLRVVLVDIAASSGGALSMLKDFTDFLALQDVGVDWVCLVSSDGISSSVPWIRVVRDVYAKRSWLHRLTWEILIAPRLVRRYAPDAVFSLQNTAVLFTRVPQVVYVTQSLPFARWHRRTCEPQQRELLISPQPKNCNARAREHQGRPLACCGMLDGIVC